MRWLEVKLLYSPNSRCTDIHTVEDVTVKEEDPPPMYSSHLQTV